MTSHKPYKMEYSGYFILIVGISVFTRVFSDPVSQTILIRPGDSATLPCLGATEERDLFKLLWYKRDQNVDQDIQLVEFVPGAKDLAPTVMVKEEDKIRLDEQSFALTINAANLSDSGLYVCKAETKTSTNESPETLIEIAVDLKVSLNEKPNSPPTAPNVTILDAESIRVEWEPAEVEENKPVDNYVVLVRIQNGDWNDAQPHPVSADYNSTVVFALWPYTDYQVSVIAANDAGNSARSTSSEWVKTLEAAPEGKPKITQVANYSDAIYIEFTPPHESKLNGELAGYVAAIKEVDCHDDAENKCEKAQVLDANITAHNFTDLKPYRAYMVSLKVYNDAGDGAPLERLIWTDEGVPSLPRIISSAVSQYVEVKWEAPDEPNGRIIRYWIYWTRIIDVNTGMMGDSKSANISVEKARNAAGMMSYKIVGLRPYNRFEIAIAAETSKGIGERHTHHAVTDVDAPTSPLITNVTLNSSTSIRVEWSRPELYYRQIDLYKIRHMAEEHDLLPQTIDVRHDDSKEIQEIILGGLKPDALYEVRVAASTKSIHSTDYFWSNFSKPVMVQTGDNGNGAGAADSNRGGIIAGIVCTTLVLIIAAIIFIIFRVYVQRRYTFIQDPDSNGQTTGILNLPEAYEDSNWKYTPIPKHDSEEIERENVSVDDFGAHVNRLHADGDLGFSQEYDEINGKTNPDITAGNSADSENKPKNRYVNIVAYDHSRVQLKIAPGKDKHTDYINANYVDGYHRPKAYVAAQGPLPCTYGDFWRMVWEQNTTVVVMITNLTEKGRRKCDQYWPNEGETQYGSMSVKLLNNYTMAHYTVRMFSLKNSKNKKKGGERVIYQYHYTDWPDHGVPEYTLPSLTFIRKSTAACVPESGPIIVHCSAGVGRTGTYIVIDSMIRQIKDKNSINIYGFLSHIRNQRNYLVQTEDQYIFTHDALMEFIRSKVTEVKDSNIPQYIEELISESQTPTLLEQQFELVTEFKPKDYHMSSALLLVNKEKNRPCDILPIEQSRARLTNKPGVEGSDYINASFLHGYNKNEEFVVTQHPLASTVSDFWRLVWDKNSMTIVLLSQVNEEDFGEFWPSKDEPMEYGNFKVSFADDNHQLSHVSRDFILQSTQDDYECTVRMISTSYWPESCSPLNTVFELVQTVKQWHSQHEEVEGPIIVVDKYGGTEAATFCALTTLNDQLQHEASVDVYYVAKLYHLKRPGIWPRKEDYHFLYKAMESLCKEASIPGERDSGIGNCSNYPASLPPSLTHSSSRLSTRQETTM